MIPPAKVATGITASTILVYADFGLGTVTASSDLRLGTGPYMKGLEPSSSEVSRLPRSKERIVATWRREHLMYYFVNAVRFLRTAF